mmetsp:Transcript_23482/g.33543  ORF Transcript_23482/g.33543 Transcript_23482/m.33543 type:complete len:483 (+) Transcript_23482:44-1492(+)
MVEELDKAQVNQTKIKIIISATATPIPMTITYAEFAAAASAYDDADWSDAPPQGAAAAPEAEGLNLLFAASQIETTTEDKDVGKDANANANGRPHFCLQCAETETDTTGAEAQVPSSITVVSNGTGDVAANLVSGNGRETAEGEAEAGAEAAEAPPHDNDSETENLAIAAIKNQEKSFPQILHEILATTECQSILHWLPNGFSFLIADKQRFSSEILPEYFRGALLDSFIRKLNRWGFRRVKSRSKGDESSFAHKNFVRDKPWRCMKMRCKSKPTYHKLPSADKTKKNTKKKKAKQRCTAAAEAGDYNINSKSLATPAPATATAPATVGIVVPTKTHPPFFATNDTVNRAFFPVSRMAASEHELLLLPNPHRNPTLPKAPAAPARFLSTDDASKILERQRQLQRQHQHLAYHQQRILHERQVLIAQMRRMHQLQLEMQRLNQMSSQTGEQFVSSRTVQRAMQAQYARDMLRSSNIHYRGERK